MPEKEQSAKEPEQMSLVYVDIPSRWTVGADMVPASGDPETVTGSVSVSAGGFSAGVRLYHLVRWRHRLDHIHSQSKTVSGAIALHIMCGAYRRQRRIGVVRSEHYSRANAPCR